MRNDQQEVNDLRRLVKLHEQTIANMLKTQHPILRDAMRYQVLRESHRDIVPVILTEHGGHMGSPEQVDKEVDRLIDAKNGHRMAA